MQVNDIAGLEPVRWDNRRMINVDITEVVSDLVMTFGPVDCIFSKLFIVSFSIQL